METFFTIIIQIAQFICLQIGSLVNALQDALAKQEAFNAEFGKESDISSPFNKGFVISRAGRLTRKKSFENVLLSAVTGAGKTTRLLAKNLFALKGCSIIVNDSSKELCQLCSGHMSRHFNILTLCFSDSVVSSGYNILARIRKPNEINKLVHMVVASSLDKGNSSDPFWSLSVKTLLQILIRLVFWHPPEFRNMANVLNLLHRFSASPDEIDKLIVATKDERLMLEYKSLVSNPEKTLQNIVASAKAALQIFDDPEIVKVTSHDTIDFQQLREKPTVIFLHNSIGDQKYLSVLTSIFFEQFYNHLFERLPAKSDLPVYCILEEASSLYIPILPIALANSRKFLCGNYVAVQSKGQLRTMYRDEADNIVANCVTKIFLPGQTSLDELREIETLGGKCIYTDEKGVERVKPLISADEIRLLPKHRSIILSGNNPIIKGRTSPYFRSLVYSRYASIPPVALAGDIPDEPTPFIK